MLYNIDLRFVVPVLVKIIIYLINRSSNSTGEADEMLIWDYLINHQNSLFNVALAFIFLLFVTAVKLSISVAVFAQPIVLRLGDFNPSLPLVCLLIASLLLTPQGLLYTYLLCMFVWIISPWPCYVWATFVNWLQHSIPIFIITAAAPPPPRPIIDLSGPSPSVYFEVDEENSDDELEINVIFGHA